MMIVINFTENEEVVKETKVVAEVETDYDKKIKKKLDLYTKIVVSYILIEIWGCHGFDW